MNGWKPPAPGAEGLFDPVTPPDAAATTQCDPVAEFVRRQRPLAPIGNDRASLYEDSGAVAMSSETQTPSAEPVAFKPGGGCDMRRGCQDAGFCVGHCKVPSATPSPDVRDAERYREALEEVVAACLPPVNAECLSQAINDAREVLGWPVLDRAIDTAIAKDREP